MGKLSATLSLLKNFKTLFSSRNSMNYLFQLTFVRMLEGLNLIEFLEKPRSEQEIYNYLENVENIEFFKKFYNILKNLVCNQIGDKIIIDKSKIDQILNYKNKPVVREFNVIYDASKEVFPEMLKAILRNEEPKLDWNYTMIVNFSQHSSDIYRKAREIVLGFADAKKHIKGGHLLDLSAGFGYEVEHLIKYFSGDIKITVVSFSKKFYNLVRTHEFEYMGKKIRVDEAEQVEDIVLIDPLKMDTWILNDSYYDGVIAFSLLHWLPNQDFFIHEISRVLKRRKPFFGFTVFYENVPDWADLFIKVQGGNRFLTFEIFDEICIAAGLEKPSYFAKLAFKTFKK